MTRLNTTFALVIVIALMLTSTLFAQSRIARLQVIHNSADPAAEMVDVYLDGTLLLDDFAFRTATPFIDAPAYKAIDVGIAPSTSSSAADTLKNFNLTLTSGETYVAVANGVLDPASFADNPDGRETDFGLFINAMGQESANDPESVELSILHGSTDAPTVDIMARDVATLVDDAAYGDMTDYLAVPPMSYLLDITDASGETRLLTYSADLSALAGGAAVVFASGFLAPQDNQDGEGFGIYVALPNGDVLTLDAITTARLQVIHNAADPAAASVDVYLNGSILLDDFAFRAATPFIDAPAGEAIDVGVAAGSSSSAADTLKNFNLTLTPGETYVAVANGVLRPDGFADNPDGRETAFGLFIKAGAREEADEGSLVDFVILHGSTDAPAVDIFARDVAQLTDDASYGDMTDYISVPANSYIIDVKDETGQSTVASYSVDLSTLAGGAAFVFASGFLSPDDDQSGPAFGIYVALPNGDVLGLPLYTSVSKPEQNAVVKDYALMQNYPNPFNPSTTIVFSLAATERVSLNVYTITGRLVAELVDQRMEAGQHSVRFEVTNLPSGTYLYWLVAGSFSETRRMTMLK